MKNKIIKLWHNVGAVVTGAIAYIVAIMSFLYGLDICRKYNDIWWLLFAIFAGAVFTLFIWMIYSEFNIEDFLGNEKHNDK